MGLQEADCWLLAADCWLLAALPMQGDGLEFKRHFLKIKGKLSDVVSSQKVWLPPP